MHESTACADYLIARGLDPALVLKEVSSYDTVRRELHSAKGGGKGDLRAERAEGMSLL